MEAAFKRVISRVMARKEEEVPSPPFSVEEDENGHFLDLPDVPHQEGKKSKQYIATLAVTLGAFGIGTSLAWTSPALTYLASNSTSLDKMLTVEEETWVGSLLGIGAILGSIPTGWTADRIGRKWTIIGLNLPALISCVLLLIPEKVWILYTARILAGFAMGGFSVVSPMYIGEIAEVSVRGTLGSYFELMLCFGILALYVIGAIANYFWMNFTLALVPLSAIIIFIFMPETPSYLLMKGKKEQAESALQYFRGVEYNIAPEMLMLQGELDKAHADTPSWRDLLSSRANVKALMISFGLMLGQQLSGVNVVIFYTEKIFQKAGSTISPQNCAVIIGVVEAVATYVSLLLVDRAGRRILLLCSAAAGFISLLVLGAYFYVQDVNPEAASAIAWLPLLAANVFIIAISIGLGPIPWLILGELFSSSFKGLATSASCLLNSATVFFMTKTYGNFVMIFGIAGTFWLYAIFVALAGIFIYFCVPETKGKSFLEIQMFLSKGHDN